MLILLLLSTLFCQATLTSVDAFTFSFPSFGPNSCIEGGDLICMGSATAGTGYISVTPDPQQGNSSGYNSPVNNVGRVLYRHPVIAWPSYISTTFTIRIIGSESLVGSGDGMAFVIAQDNRPSPPGSYGSNLGLLDRETEGGSIHQLGVELDTYMNEFDPDDNHIGIDTTSVRYPITAKSLSSIGINLKLGKPIKIKIDYDGWGKILQIYVGYVGDPLVSFLNQSIIMAKTVPRSVYVGFTASTGTVSETHQVLDWIFTSITLPDYSLKVGIEKEDHVLSVLIIAIVIFGLLVSAMGTFWLLRKHFYKIDTMTNRENEDIESRSQLAANGPRIFTYKQLSKATLKFSKENLLGTGGFGSVYRGTISDPPFTIAVKKISAKSKQGEREYLAEISTIGRLRHKYILQLLGWCNEREHLLLVYEYMPNGSLDRFIGKVPLAWEIRYKILTGLASALLYLHEDCGSPMIHRDVKPNNVMLDSELKPRLGDFGLARLLQDEASVTTKLAGTPGYMAPEVGFIGKATPESDVYSFGMVVLEVVCGKRSKWYVEENSLVDYVWSLHGKGELLESVDEMLGGEFEAEQVKRALGVGLACLLPDATSRPKIRKVVQIFMNPSEPLMELPETRPDGVYLSLHSSSATTTTGFGSTAVPSLISTRTLDEKTTVQCNL